MKNYFKMLKQYIFEPKYRFSINSMLGLYNSMDDETYLKKLYKVNMGKNLNLDSPQTFNEKMQWLKIYDRKPEYTKMVDKYEAKKYVASIIGNQYIIPTLGVWDDFDDIDFDALPNQFVLKCTHDSGGLVICKDKSKFDVKAAKKKIEKSLARNYYLSCREWPYKDVPRKIICEEYMENETSEELEDYKLMCFNGKVKASFVCSNRFSKDGLNVTIYDTDWKRLPFERYYHPASKTEIAKPVSYDEMVRLAETLAKNIPFVRVDFYEVKGKPYFGELTFFPASGFEEFKPEEWDKELGTWIKLPEVGGYLICSEGYILWLHMDMGANSLKDDKRDDFKVESKRLYLYNKLNGHKGIIPNEYQFWCFNGVPMYVSVIYQPHGDNLKATYDMNWIRQPFVTSLPMYSDEIEKPGFFEEIKELAERLCRDQIFVRVDFMLFNSNIYFGELTKFPAAGMVRWEPSEWDAKLGDLLDINSLCR